METGSRARRGPLREIGRGAGAFLGGIAFVVRTPRALGRAFLPAAVAVAVGVALSAAAVWGVARLSAVVVSRGGGFGTFERILFDLLFGGVAVFAALVLTIAIAQPLTRGALARLATPLEAARHPRARPLGPSSGLLAALGVALSALGITLPTVGALELLTLFAPEAAFVTEPIAFAVSALGLAWEIFDHPFSRRGLTLGERLRWMRESFFAVLGFAAAAQAFLLIPGLDLFLLPVGIAGATRLFADRERQEERDEKAGADALAPALPPKREESPRRLT
jgi:uncharacterized protein involved in cysteine biosynthesis